MIRRLRQIDEQNKETITRAITGNITSATTRTKRTTLASVQKAASLPAHHAKYTPLTAKQTYSKHTTEAYSSKKFWLT